MIKAGLHEQILILLKMENQEGMCYQWIVFSGVFYCLDDFNLSAEEVSYILDTSSDSNGNFVYNTNTATHILIYTILLLDGSMPGPSGSSGMY